MFPQCPLLFYSILLTGIHGLPTTLLWSVEFEVLRTLIPGRFEYSGRLEIFSNAPITPKYFFCLFNSNRISDLSANINYKDICTSPLNCFIWYSCLNTSLRHPNLTLLTDIRRVAKALVVSHKIVSAELWQVEIRTSKTCSGLSSTSTECLIGTELFLELPLKIFKLKIPLPVVYHLNFLAEFTTLDIGVKPIC